MRDESEARLDRLFDDAFETNAEPMLDYIQLKFELKHLRAAAAEAETLRAETSAAALVLMTLLGPVSVDAAIVGRTYGWPEVLDIANRATMEFRETRAKIETLREAVSDLLASTPVSCPECGGRRFVVDAPSNVLDGRSYLERCPMCNSLDDKSDPPTGVTYEP
jgi:hypothetical protein